MSRPVSNDANRKRHSSQQYLPNSNQALSGSCAQTPNATELPTDHQGMIQNHPRYGDTQFTISGSITCTRWGREAHTGELAQRGGQLLQRPAARQVQAPQPRQVPHAPRQRRQRPAPPHVQFIQPYRRAQAARQRRESSAVLRGQLRQRAQQRCMQTPRQLSTVATSIRRTACQCLPNMLCCNETHQRSPCMQTEMCEDER